MWKRLDGPHSRSELQENEETGTLLPKIVPRQLTQLSGSPGKPRVVTPVTLRHDRYDHGIYIVVDSLIIPPPPVLAPPPPRDTSGGPGFSRLLSMLCLFQISISVFCTPSNVDEDEWYSPLFTDALLNA